MKPGLKIALLGTVAFAIYNELQKRNPNPPVYKSNFITGKYNAKTIPPFGIFVKPTQANNHKLLAHELVHWQQYQREGLIPFAANYYKAHKTFGYDNNPYEIEARQLTGESVFCQKNYTYCVQNGIASAVESVNFRV